MAEVGAGGGLNLGLLATSPVPSPLDQPGCCSHSGKTILCDASL